MPREIKFRGKNIDGQWHYGQLAVLAEDLMGGKGKVLHFKQSRIVIMKFVLRKRVV